MIIMQETKAGRHEAGGIAKSCILIHRQQARTENCTGMALKSQSPPLVTYPLQVHT